MTVAIDNDEKVTVCSECHRAACWHGTFMCEESRNASTVEMTVAELRELKLEHENWWML